MRAPLVLASSALAALALTPAVASSDAQPHVRTIDRTFSCGLVSRGDGTFDLGLAAYPHIRQEWTPGELHIVPAYLIVTSGANSLDADLVTVRAGPIKGISRTQPAGAFAHSRKCKPSRAAVALSSRGLPYEGASWGAGVECRAPRRILVRVKATFKTDTPWRKVDASYAGGRSPVVDAAVAVRTETKSSLLGYMTVRKGKTASIKYSGRCS
jgi:hypothetical protein